MCFVSLVQLVSSIPSNHYIKVRQHEKENPKNFNPFITPYIKAEVKDETKYF